MLEPKIFYRQGEEKNYSQLVFDNDLQKIVRHGEFTPEVISKLKSPIRAKVINISYAHAMKYQKDLRILFDIARSWAVAYSLPVAAIDFDMKGLERSIYEDPEMSEALDRGGVRKRGEIKFFAEPFA